MASSTMFVYWFFGLLMVVPLLAVATVISLLARRYTAFNYPWGRWVGHHPIVLWGGLCAVNGLCWWGLYHATNRTIYAPHYTEALFQQVSVGMDTSQVRALLGAPLEHWRPYQYGRYLSKQHYVSYIYSRSEGGGDYDIRQINFDNGRVSEVKRYRYYD